MIDQVISTVEQVLGQFANDHIGQTLKPMTVVGLRVLIIGELNKLKQAEAQKLAKPPSVPESK